jgi:transketolase
LPIVRGPRRGFHLGMPTALAELHELMALQTGDEKHGPSATSTLDVLHVLYDRVLRFDPADPAWEGRDRFLLSKGHGPMAFYAVLARAGFFPREELRRFQTWEGLLGGHPDRLLVPGVEVSTGSLGHGLPMAVGVAHALRAKGLDEQRVFVLVGDAELNEGTNWEAILYGGDAGLANLTLIVVDNSSGTVSMGSIAAKLSAFGWDAVTVDGRDHEALEQALTHETDGPDAVVAVIDR